MFFLSNFTANSTYQANLNRIVSQLSSFTEFNSEFHNLSTGEGLDKVFAVGLCLGDRIPDQCSSCLNYTANKLMERCPWGKEVVAWSQYCTVRYANRNIFGQLDRDPRTCVYNTENVSYVYDYTELLSDFLNNLSMKAAAGSPLLKYAADIGGPVRKYADDGITYITYQVYGMVQCTPDLTEQNCRTCLNFTIPELQECCVGRIGCRILRPSCILRIESGPFYNNQISAIPLPSPAAPSPSPIEFEGPYGYEYSEESNTWLNAVTGAAAGLTWNGIVVLSIAVIFGIRLTVIVVLSIALILIGIRRACLSTKVIGFRKKGAVIFGITRVYLSAKVTGFRKKGAVIFGITRVYLSAKVTGFWKKGAVIFGITREYLSTKVIGFWKKGASDDQNVMAFLRNYGSLAPKQFSYSDVKKMTNSFQHKVGQGGYGTVYRGKRVDGSLVAVKVLRESKSNGEEFINEIASISRTSHVNIVSFVGFCYERRKRALVYEYMPNGSLDEFIHDQGTSTRRHDQLECTTLYKISLGIAKGLEYLHQGCNTRIVHFDIKPQNILLDEDFCPKIADFGLAKLCQRKDSIVSMMGARGTIGYIAPEVFYRNYGGVSHKSDVYSYGMVVLEMVVSKRKPGAAASAMTSEMYFPDWIYKDLEQGIDVKLQENMSEEDRELARKMIIVGLWCIQTSPADRPPISKVIEMLEGSLDCIQVPPKPFLFSPTRSALALSSSITLNYCC